MSARFIPVDRETRLMLPPDMRDWVPKGDLVHFIVDTIKVLPLRNVRVNHRGTGSPQYPPKMMLMLLIYCYSRGIFSSRQIEKATWYDVAVRYICGMNAHPDHDTICDFRRKNRELFEETFLKVLLMAKEMGLLKVGRISLDGTKIKANASKHKAVSYGRAGKKIEQLKEQISELLTEADVADKKGEDPGLDIPSEISRREEYIKRLETARKRMEERLANDNDDDEENNNPPPVPGEKDQVNFTDPDSRIMKAGNGKHFEQAYNAQCAVDTDGSMLIVGTHVTNKPNDTGQLKGGVESVPDELGPVKKLAADAGYKSGKEIRELEHPEEGKSAVRVYVPCRKEKHGKTVADLKAAVCRKKEDPGSIDTVHVWKSMEERMASEEGRAFYDKRKITVEPAFGIIKNVIGFRQFMLRGLDLVNCEWKLVTIAYNMKRIARMLNQAAVLA